MFIKICGITRASDASHAAAHGATAVGFVFWPRSPRCIAPAAAAEIVATLPPGVTPVGVFVNQSLESILETVARAGISMVQLHGDEPPDFGRAIGHPLLRARSIDEASTERWPAETTLLLDAADPVARGGTGRTIDWNRAAEIASRRPIVLAGGLTPENVAEAITRVRPFGVDVSSGVEASPGVKSADKVSRFLAEARRAFAGIQVRG